MASFDSHSLFHLVPVHFAVFIGANDSIPGFKNAQRKAAEYALDRSKPNPFQNADSNSLFTVGAWIISHGGGPINADGTFGTPQATPKARI